MLIHPGQAGQPGAAIGYHERIRTGPVFVMVPIYTPRSPAEASAIAALLRAYGVRFHFQGEAFSHMYPGPLGNSLNVQKLMVAESHLALARALLQDFIDPA